MDEFIKDIRELITKYKNVHGANITVHMNAAHVAIENGMVIKAHEHLGSAKVSTEVVRVTKKMLTQYEEVVIEFEKKNRQHPRKGQTRKLLCQGNEQPQAV